mmetsp:Transcript_107473/g.149815  ORF Transcript_107473/g.149815 Transcript_107473/m.149815 type:complete len:82 (-) Transcript_107473:843-1088(-)
MEGMPLNARFMRPHIVHNHIGTRGGCMEKEVGHTSECVAEEKRATFHPYFPETSGWSGGIGSFANMMLQMHKTIEWLNLMV